MNEKTKKTAGDGGGDGEERLARRRHWLRVRRRFVGAAAVFLLIGLLWQLGDDARAPKIAPALPPSAEFAPLTPSAEIQAAAAVLDEAESIAVATEPEITEPPADNSAEDAAAEPAEELAEEAEESAARAETAAAESAAKETVAAETAAAGSGEDSDGAEKENFPPGFYVVQLGAFNVEKRARRLTEKLKEKLRGKQFYVAVYQAEHGGVKVFRVRAVGYQTRAEAKLARQKLHALGYESAIVLDVR